MRNLISIACATTLLLAATVTFGAAPAKTPAKRAPRKRKPNPVMAPIKDVAGLPRALLIGDSISIGYTLPVRKLLAGKVNVHRIPTNGGPTTRGLAGIDAWLGDSKWDLIHFNWGLHDLKYCDPNGKLVPKEKGKVQVPPEEYEKNLRKLVARLKKTGAKLIWCATTPVPEGATGRVKGDSAKYNAIAAKVMADAKIPTDDLYTFALKRLEKIQRPKNVHFTQEGSMALGRQVANHILKALGQPPLPEPKAPAAKGKASVK